MRQLLLGSEAFKKFTISMSIHLSVILGLDPRTHGKGALPYQLARRIPICPKLNEKLFRGLNFSGSGRRNSNGGAALPWVLGSSPRMTARWAHFGIQAPSKLTFVGWHSRSTL